MHWQALLILPLLLLAAACPALDLPADPRPQVVADPGHHLSSAARQQIDGIAREARSAQRGELVVVVIDSSEGRVLRQVGTELFNRWRLGDRVRNDGLLIIAALNDHRCELVLGSGIDGAAHVAASQRIFDEVMKPRFRVGDTDGALVDGARAAARRILGVGSSPAAVSVPVPVPVSVPAPVRVAAAQIAESRADPTAGIAVEAPARTAEPAADPEYQPAQQSAPPAVRHADAAQDEWTFPWAWLWCGVAVAALIGLWRLRHWWRYHPRQCPSCSATQTLLGELAEDAHLERGEQSEERVGSVDHDVWHCVACGRVDKLAWRAWLTSYAACPGCCCRTLSSTSTTLAAATTWSEGRVQVDERCANCTHRASRIRRTPRRTPTSYSSGRSSSGSGGSFGGGSGSGGGRSSGGGGGGSW